jgi:hypothetical protein
MSSRLPLSGGVGVVTDAPVSSEAGAGKGRRSLASFLSSRYGVTFIDPIEGGALPHHESDWSTAPPLATSPQTGAWACHVSGC